MSDTNPNKCISDVQNKDVAANATTIYKVAEILTRHTGGPVEIGRKNGGIYYIGKEHASLPVHEGRQKPGWPPYWEQLSEVYCLFEDNRPLILSNDSISINFSAETRLKFLGYYFRRNAYYLCDSLTPDLHSSDFMGNQPHNWGISEYIFAATYDGGPTRAIRYNAVELLSLRNSADKMRGKIREVAILELSNIL
jgi:hypothetical protein